MARLVSYDLCNRGVGLKRLSLCFSTGVDGDRVNY